MEKGWNEWETPEGKPIWGASENNYGWPTYETTPGNNNEVEDWVIGEIVSGGLPELERFLGKHAAFLAFLDTQESPQEDSSWPEAA